jgi:hypothetical protein
MAEKGNAHSRYANQCVSCSSLFDGMPESNLSSFPDFDNKMLVEEVYSASHGQTHQSVPPH